MSRYGELNSIRHKAKDTNDLLNRIVSQFGSSIEWHKRTGCHEIKRDHRAVIFFSLRGNKWADWLQLLSSDVEVLKSIKAAFPDDFKADVQTKEGVL